MIPTAAPLTKDQLGEAYLECVEPYNDRAKRINKRLVRATKLAEARRAKRDLADALGIVAECVRTIEWPAEYGRDVRDFLKAHTTLQVTVLAQSRADSDAEYLSYQDTFEKQALKVTSAANQLRGSLDLPPPPIR